MKRPLLVFFFLSICLAVSTNAFAQKRKRLFIKMGPTFGVKGGIGIAGVSGSGTSDAISPLSTTSYSSRLGLVGGALFNYRFTPQLSLQTELLYDGRGFVAKGSNNSERREMTYVLNYVSAPILAKLNAKIFVLEAGLSPSYFIGGSVKTDITKVSGGTGKKDEEISAGIKPFDMCWTIGAGVELVEGLLLDIRLTRGFSSVGTPTNNALNLGGHSLANSSTQITAGYIFSHYYGGSKRRH